MIDRSNTLMAFGGKRTLPINISQLSQTSKSSFIQVITIVANKSFNIVSRNVYKCWKTFIANVRLVKNTAYSVNSSLKRTIGVEDRFAKYRGSSISRSIASNSNTLSICETSTLPINVWRLLRT